MTRRIVTYRCGDVVVVLFPFVDHDVQRPRPALVLSSADFNENHDHIILAMITTASRSSWPSDVEIRDLGEAGLRRRSVVRWKIFSKSIAQLGPTIGALSMHDRTSVFDRQKLVFDFD
jgi:mRNA interferase MazF